MQTGKIARIMDKGFGFISSEESSKDLFFHMNDVDGDFDSLREGDVVSFEIVDGDRGKAAVNVTKA